MAKERTKPRLHSKSYHVTVEGCPDHPEGCYLRVSEEGDMIVIDFDVEGAMVGIEFVYGLKPILSCDKGEGG